MLGNRPFLYAKPSCGGPVLLAKSAESSRFTMIGGSEKFAYENDIRASFRQGHRRAKNPQKTGPDLALAPSVSGYFYIGLPGTLIRSACPKQPNRRRFQAGGFFVTRGIPK